MSHKYSAPILSADVDCCPAGYPNTIVKSCWRLYLLAEYSLLIPELDPRLEVDTFEADGPEGLTW